MTVSIHTCAFLLWFMVVLWFELCSCFCAGLGDGECVCDGAGGLVGGDWCDVYFFVPCEYGVGVLSSVCGE